MQGITSVGCHGKDLWINAKRPVALSFFYNSSTELLQPSLSYSLGSGTLATLHVSASQVERMGELFFLKGRAGEVLSLEVGLKSEACSN